MIDKIKSWFTATPPPAPTANFVDPWLNRLFDGDKFAGGFGETKLQIIDYWTLRARSAQLFNENHYARGIIRRLVTNEINTGLMPEACPDPQILGLSEDVLNDWTEKVETRYSIWAKTPELCDWEGRQTMGAIQRAARLEALVEGDVLVVLRQSRRTRLPRVQLIRGGRVNNPLGAQSSIRKGHKIKHGVEFDSAGRTVAYWVSQNDFTSKRVPAFGEKSGRRIAWLVYGTDKRLDDIRGQPLLSLVLQSLKEIDRYRDSTQRKAVVNSILAMFIKKNADKMGTLPITGGAVRRGSTAAEVDNKPRTFGEVGQVPGVVLEELQVGEEPVGFKNLGTDEKFGEFEGAIIHSIAWANEMPPEILRLTFTNNYSASQAAINEFKIYLNKIWSDQGETFNGLIYVEWLLSEVLLKKIDAPGLLESWRDPQMYDTFGAWIMADWYGAIKPSTDMLKQANGSKLLVQEGWSTNARESRITTGTKFSKNIARIKRENQLKVEAARPMAEFEREFAQPTEPIGE